MSYKIMLDAGHGGDDKLDHDIIDHGTEADGQQLQREVAEDPAEDRLADDDGRKTDDDGAASHIDVGRALILCKQGARDGYDSVGEHQADDDVGLGIDALCTDVLYCKRHLRQTA